MYVNPYPYIQFYALLHHLLKQTRVLVPDQLALSLVSACLYCLYHGTKSLMQVETDVSMLLIVRYQYQGTVYEVFNSKAHVWLLTTC